MTSHWKRFRSKYLIVSIIISFIITCFINILPFGIDNCKCQECNCQSDGNNLKQIISPYVSRHLQKFHHRLAILVPFRDRFEELLSFAPHMKQFLDKQNINYHIFVLHQIDKFRFNRASLINVGFIYVKKEFDYIAMHDVDLLPINDNLSYQFPNVGPYHVSSPDLHPRYHYSTFIGGILLINCDHFIAVNGMSNKYWGWGLEDDEFYVRLKEANLKINRPKNITTGINNTFKHIHDKNHRKRDMAKCFNQREVTRKRDRQTGMNNVLYNIEKIINMTISNVSMTILNIALICDKSLTPWCECTKANEINYHGIKDKKETINHETQGDAAVISKKKNYN